MSPMVAEETLDNLDLPIHPTAARPFHTVKIDSDNVRYEADCINATYEHRANIVRKDGANISVIPVSKTWKFETRTTVAKTGLMVVGLGGNNGSTLMASLEANRNNICWRTQEGEMAPNFIGSLIRASTVRLGADSQTGNDVNVSWSEVLPLLHPNDLVVSGWDISATPMDKAIRRAKVLDWDLQRQVSPLLKEIVPLPSVMYPTFAGEAMDERADNLLDAQKYPTKWSHVEKFRADIRDFKEAHELDTVIVLWSASTERFVDQRVGLNDTAENLIASIKADDTEVSPSTIFAVASILESAVFINGAPQNTNLPGVIQLAEEKGAFIAGDDFKSGQTKLKSVLADYLVNAGIKPLSIASYNHLGNADGKNLQSDPQFKSKEITKKGVIDDLTAANYLLYKPADKSKGEKVGEHPDHIIVIKYLEAVGDNKRAIDEYNSEIFMGGRNVLSIYQTCADSLLATPLILDLVILAELMTRIKSCSPGETEFKPMHSILSLLSYMTKAPLCKSGHEVVNSLSRQRGALEAFFKACVGLAHSEDLNLESRTN